MISVPGPELVQAAVSERSHLGPFRSVFKPLKTASGIRRSDLIFLNPGLGATEAHL
jgi:hypothetical protein